MTRLPCVISTGARTAAGYARVTVGGPGRGNHRGRAPAGREVYAHRLAWEEAHGPIPDGLHVLHRCDNPPCILALPTLPDGTPDPDEHLFLGTQADNDRDRDAKGRTAMGAALPQTRLDAARVIAIRERIAAGDSSDVIGRAFGVSGGAIRAIRSGRTWRHVR